VLALLREGGRIDEPSVYQLASALARALRVQVEHTLHDNRLTALLSPVTAAAGVRADATSVAVAGREMNTADALSRYTALASVTGLPALSVPAGLAAACPVGVQLIGAAYDERALALLAKPVEQGPGVTAAAQRKILEPVPEDP